jgi:hypothetical protein
MRIGFMVAAIFALTSGALAENYGRPTAILVSPIHEAQIAPEVSDAPPRRLKLPIAA